ncbi:DNA utilization protein GntX [Cedecea neteri]|uniref:DNA utilization protein GntX n=1 Tax=Cedecea neteri TaxID=158822 RepID=A0A291DSE8_9ENTR|nr:DNA utilization protein GntX [Cedecea neteri]ATF90707.1 DNA utilization protein GntX [Cedecea neteri]SQA98980.1 DNA utilization protein GntX [Cedecea neteri]
MLTIPGRCWLCQLPLACSGWGICSCCTTSLVKPQACCPQCGLPALSGSLPCGRCLQRMPEWDAITYVTDYLPPLSTLIHHLKFTGTPSLAPALARLLLLRILASRREGRIQMPDSVLSVPLHHTRAWRRGYNQSALIATPLARWLGCKYFPFAIKRIRSSPAQHTLTAKERKRNLKGIFRVEIPVAGRHMAIVDDVVTTGSTVAEIARLLKKQGAATVQVWCLCRTL